MINDPYREIAHGYDLKVHKYGYSTRATDYGHPGSQRLKFSALTEVMPLLDKSILDVGCGFADLQNFLAERGIESNYTGYDISEAMIDIARQRHPGVQLEVRNILNNPPNQKFDVVLSTGIFFLLQNNAKEIMHEMITIMYKLANHAVAFTTLSAWAEDKELNEFYADPGETLDFCRTLTPRLVLRHDYHPRDFAIYMYRN